MSNIFNLNLDDEDNGQSFFDIECPCSPVWDLTNCPSLRDSFQPEPSIMEECSEQNAIWPQYAYQNSKSGFFSPSLGLFIECTPRYYQELLDHINKIKKMQEERSIDDLINLSRDNDSSQSHPINIKQYIKPMKSIEHYRTQIEFQ